MGNINITYTAVALAIALIFLLIGFFWGRSKVNSRVEDVLEKQRPALAAREFALRQQLDDAMDEIVRLRPFAEELARVQERLKNEQTKRERIEVRFSSTGKDVPSGAIRDQAGAPQESRATSESADEAIKKLMQSLEKFNQPAESSAPGKLQHELQKTGETPEKAPRAPLPTVSQAIVPQTQEKKPSVPAPEPGPRVAAPVAPQPRPQAMDEWQEFARSLAAYRKKTEPPTGAKKG